MRTPLIIQDVMAAHAVRVEDFIAIEEDWAWGQGTVSSGYMSDYDWLSISVTGAERVMRFRGQYRKGHWSSWFYVYAPEYLVTPEEFS